MDVFVANEQEIPVDEARLAALARHALAAEQVGDEVELSVLLVTSDHIRRLNARFSGDDQTTDVLAFPMSEEAVEDDDDITLLGDVVICPRVAQRYASRLGHGLYRELDTLLVHGTLHLLGYDHQGVDDKARMDARTQELLASFDAART